MSISLWLLQSAGLLSVVLLAERLTPSPRARRRVLAAGLAAALLLPLLPSLPIPAPAASVAEWTTTPLPLPLPALDVGEAPPVASAAAVALSLGAVAGWLYVAGVLLLSLRALAGRWWIAGVVSRGEPSPAEGAVPVVFTDALTGPGLTGPWPRAILLPRAAEGWTDTQRRHVLAHERAHAAAGDDWAGLLAQAAGVLLWPNPLVILVRRRMRLAAELLADQAVLQSGASPLSYAETLAALARSARPVPSAVVALGGPSPLEQRVRALVGKARKQRIPRVRAASAGGLVVAALLVTRVTWAPAQAEPLLAPAPAPLQVAVTQEVERLQREWRPEAVAIVVVDPATGAVVARAGAATERPMVLGSVLKPFTVLAALQAGMAPSTPLPGHGGDWDYSGFRVQDYRTHEMLDMETLLVHSSNVGAVALVDAVGADAVLRTHAAFGLEAPAVAAGEDTARLAMGLGTRLSAEQLAQAYAALWSAQQGSGSAAFVVDALRAAVGEGTGQQAAVSGRDVAGKTGTALTEGGAPVASFVGWWDTGASALAMAVVVVAPEGEAAYGGRVAAPAFARIVASAERP